MTYRIDLNWQPFEIEREEENEDGEKVKTPTGIKMMIKPLSYEANQEMMIYAQKNSDIKDLEKSLESEEGEASIELATINNPDLPILLKTVIPPHVKDLEGLEFKPEGKEEFRPVTIEDLLAHGCFMTLALSVFTKLSAISNFLEGEKQEAKKKLPGSLEDN